MALAIGGGERVIEPITRGPNGTVLPIGTPVQRNPVGGGEPITLPTSPGVGTIALPTTPTGIIFPTDAPTVGPNGTVLPIGTPVRETSPTLSPIEGSGALPSGPGSVILNPPTGTSVVGSASNPTAPATVAPGSTTNTGSTTLSGTTDNTTDDPLLAAITALLGTGNNAYGPGGTDESGTTAPASTAGLQDIQPVAGDTTTTSSSSLTIIVIVGLLIAVGAVLYFHHKKTGKWL